jgi:ATP-binding cassette, subfamily B, bacterial MsbA
MTLRLTSSSLASFPFKRHLLPYKGTFAAAILCGAIAAVANGVGIPLLVKQVFPKIFDDDSGLTLLAVLGYASLIPLLFLVRAGAGFLNAYLVNVAGLGMLERLRAELFSKLQALPLGYFGRRSSGDLLSRMVADTQQAQQALTAVAADIVKQPLTLVAAVGYLVWLSLTNSDVVFLLLTLAVVPLCVFPIRSIGKKMLKRALQTQQELGTLSERVAENLAGAREVRAFCLEERETARFREDARRLMHVQLKVAKYSQLLSPSIEVISSIGIAASFVYAYQAGIGWNVFLSILTALFMCYEPLKKVGAIHNQLQRGVGAAERIEEVVREPVTIADPADPVPVGRLAGELVFENVSFSYGEAPTLSGINLRIPRGSVCALVGPSGAGKSTFAALVPRFYDVTKGALLIDGIDTRQMKLGDLRRNIAVVPQDPVLFNATVIENLLLGRPGASPEEAEAAARQAFAHDFIQRLPQGYHTVVGERGALLSGGQKQRIAIARAFLRDAPILILDEATSALDSESEEMIQLALRDLVRGRTAIVIAHRFSAIRDANLILVFDHGQVVASGSHQELYGATPLYTSLYDRQR